MSSIQQAVAVDIHGVRAPGKNNPVVQNHRSQRDDGNVHAEEEERRKQEAMVRRQARLAEGGRGGGFNDRQELAHKEQGAAEDEDGYDDFGRRVGGRKKSMDQNARAQAALERLRNKSSHGGERSRDKSRSRSPRNRRR
mmetsp:Transcript_108258/g.188020  ORF Transcript_108258/g.188020 Transcript_108258/m.188020 type:complete len:139 (-) Transcript_108258:11-427(-)